MKKIIKIQFFVILVGMIFSWSAFVIDLFNWLNFRNCAADCEIYGNPANPFLTIGFYGAAFFTLAFFLNLLMLLFNRKNHKEPEPEVEEINKEPANQDII